jgi:hypothetical protein
MSEDQIRESFAGRVLILSYDGGVNLFGDLVEGVPLNISASLFTVYSKCPQQALARVQGIYGAPSVAAFKGNLAHKIFASHLEDGEIPSEEFEQRCKEMVGRHFGEQMASLHMTKSSFSGVVVQVGELYERFKLLPTDGFSAAETPFDVDLGNGLTLKGRIDAVYDDEHGRRIVDWKTGSFLGDAAPQLEFYAMAWQVLHDELPIATEASSLATGENMHIAPTQESVESTIHSVGEMVERLRLAIEAGSDLARVAGPYCRWCPLLDTCDEGASALEILSAGA